MLEISQAECGPCKEVTAKQYSSVQTPNLASTAYDSWTICYGFCAIYVYLDVSVTLI